MGCKHASVVRGQNMQEVIECGYGLFKANAHVVPFRVAECSEYLEKNVPSLHEMKEIAWNIEARKRGPAGFDAGNNEIEVIITGPKKNSDNIPFDID